MQDMYLVTHADDTNEAILDLISKEIMLKYLNQKTVLRLLDKNICSRNIVNLKILQSESILAHISGTRFFPSKGFVEKHSK